MNRIPACSIGVGDRFGMEGEAQLRAVDAAAKEADIQIAPVWNKSFREHSLTRSTPDDVRAEADAAVEALGWNGAYFVDADHIRLENVPLFAASSDFFTIDVASFIGVTTASSDYEDFAVRHSSLSKSMKIPGLEEPLRLGASEVMEIASKYLAAIRAAGTVYRKIRELRGADDFVTEISMDETLSPQTPAELLVILAGLADERIPLQTIAPKFSGEFHKGVDYIGDPEFFAREFNADICVVKYASAAFGLPDNLKLSVHSGSDKFSIYPYMAEAMKRHRVGVHLKTAGTTWLEEVAGLAVSGGDALAIVKEVYGKAFHAIDELSRPYSAVISIDATALPSPEEVADWTGADFADAVAHDASSAHYNRNLRQLMHIAYPIAAQAGRCWQEALLKNRERVADFVSENLLVRHLRPLWCPK